MSATLTPMTESDLPPDTYRPTPRSALRYYGGKRSLAAWIIGYFPPHACYVEPFGGAMGVLLSKAPSKCEVYNDYDGEIVNFFRVLREQPEELIRAIKLTPYARAEVDRSCAKTGEETPLEDARLTYVRAWQSRHGLPAVGAMGWRYDVGDSSQNIDAWRTGPDTLWAIVDRLKQVQLECDDAFKLFPRYDRKDTLWYVDPPYIASTRGSRWATTAYKHELSDQQHADLAKVLRTLKGAVILSGYDSPLYDDLYAGWHAVKRESATHSNDSRVETLWMNHMVKVTQPYLISL